MLLLSMFNMTLLNPTTKHINQSKRVNVVSTFIRSVSPIMAFFGCFQKLLSRTMLLVVLLQNPSDACKANDIYKDFVLMYDALFLWVLVASTNANISNVFSLFVLPGSAQEGGSIP